MPSEKILQQKKAEVEKLNSKLTNAQAFVLADYRALPSAGHQDEGYA